MSTTARRDLPARRVRHIRFRDRDEWRLIEAQAAVHGIAPSTYVREAALREARSELAATPGGRSDQP
jgi:hypothetical protein